MKIETRFNIGDIIYLIREFRGKWYVENIKFEIVEIVQTVFESWTNIKLSTEKGITYRVSKIDCFATKAEAQKECDRRNNE